MARILVIEDEAVLRRSMVRGLAKLAGAEVVEAADLDAALAELGRCTPDVIISDIDLPGRSGLELLGELGRRHLHIPVVYASGYLRAYQSQIPHHADVDILEKPVPLEELRQVVKRRLRASRSSIEIAPFSVADYLQLAAMGHHSVIVEIVCGDSELGEIAVWNGQPWTARDRQGAGEAALRRLAFANGATVLCRTLQEHPGEQTLNGNWEWMLMEAARQADEMSSSGALDGAWEAAVESDEVTEPDSEPDSVPSEPEPERQKTEAEIAFEHEWERGIDALLRKDYAEAMAAFVEARRLSPADPKVHANIVRLGQLGIADPEAAPAPSAD